MPITIGIGSVLAAIGFALGYFLPLFVIVFLTIILTVLLAASSAGAGSKGYGVVGGMMALANGLAALGRIYLVVLIVSMWLGALFAHVSISWH